MSPLEFLTAALAPDGSRRDALHHSLAEGTIDWRQVIWLASGHLVTPSLTASLERYGLLSLLPQEVTDYLEANRYLNRERNQILRNELIRIAERLNAIGIEPLLLKGANALLPGTYDGAEDRIIGDLDLWISPSRVEDASAAIAEAGYRTAHESWQWVLPSDRHDHHHEIPLLHPQLPVKVELHRRLLHDSQDAECLARPLRSVSVTLSEGIRVLSPDPLTRLRHNMLHAQITDRHRQQRQLNLRQLLEFASIARHHRDEIDPRRLLQGLRPQRHRTLFEYWAQAEHWLGLPYPTDLPRSRAQGLELWLIDRTATRKAWAKGFQVYGGLLRLPRRLLSLGQRVFLMPGYFPAKIKSLMHPQG